MPRTIEPFIREQFPSPVRDGDNELFLIFMEEYYKWLEEEGNPGDIYNNLRTTIEIEDAVTEFFEEMRVEYLPCIPTSALNDKATLVKRIRELYRAKGSVKSIECLFRLLFNEEINIVTEVSETSEASIRVQTSLPDFETEATDRLIKGTLYTIVTDGGTGSYTIGETVSQNVAGGTATGEVVFWDGKVLQVTDTNLEFEYDADSDPVVGGTSGASYVPVFFLDNSFEAKVESVVDIGEGSPPVYDMRLTNIVYETLSTDYELYLDFANQFTAFDTGLANILINQQIVTLDTSGVPFDLRTLGVISRWEVDTAGADYEKDVIVPFGAPGDGNSGEVQISKIYENRIQLPGTWDHNVDLSKLDYTPFDNETVGQYIFVGNTVEVDGTKYQVIAVDDDASFIQLDSNLAGTEDLEEIYKTFNDDTLGVKSLRISNPGWGYTTTPTLDFTGLGDGNATGTVVIDGSYDPDTEVDKGDAFGYVIQSKIPFSQYVNVLKKTVHPAGFKVTGELISIAIDPAQLNLRIGELFAPLRENYDNPNTVNNRYFFEMCLKMESDYHGTLGELYKNEIIFDVASPYDYPSGWPTAHDPSNAPTPIAYYDEQDLIVEWYTSWLDYATPSP